MNLLVLDGNSIVNRAFYGIKLLTTKSGYYTNAIYGFLNILLKLQDTCHPDGVAVAFDVHEPTFRHKQYADYKAGRKPMPQELRAQMPVLKELLIALGYTTVECPGWEADDVLGTLAAACRDSGDTCFIATGDRDALQLAHGGVKVLLARTKMGQAVTDVYDEAAIAAEYGITPQALIQVKALLDASRMFLTNTATHSGLKMQGVSGRGRYSLFRGLKVPANRQPPFAHTTKQSATTASRLHLYQTHRQVLRQYRLRSKHRCTDRCRVISASRRCHRIRAC